MDNITDGMHLTDDISPFFPLFSVVMVLIKALLVMNPSSQGQTWGSILLIVLQAAEAVFVSIFQPLLDSSVSQCNLDNRATAASLWVVVFSMLLQALATAGVLATHHSHLLLIIYQVSTVLAVQIMPIAVLLDKCFGKPPPEEHTEGALDTKADDLRTKEADHATTDPKANVAQYLSQVVAVPVGDAEGALEQSEAGPRQMHGCVSGEVGLSRGVFSACCVSARPPSVGSVQIKSLGSF